MTIEDVHTRTRKARGTAIAEDYAEAIAAVVATKGVCKAIDLVRQFAVTHATVNNTVARLQRDGLVQTAPYQPITLTAAGEKIASRSRKRHETVLRFLRKLGVSEKAAAIDSEGIEHHVGKETLAAMRKAIEKGWPAEPK
ncbi:MAG: manganese-binding transcriptional regulator MntR [Pirellulaceae bacterium]